MSKVYRQAWSIAVGIFAVIVVIAAFHVTRTAFQTVVISGIALLYITLIACYRLIVIALVSHEDYSAQRVRVVLRHLNYPDIERYEEAAAKARDEHERTLMRDWAYWLSDFVIWLIVLYQLFTVVF
ncbi:MAG TPA: hypothetical protein VJR90_04010 [Gammaproteobacteria bacterium]|nr:hypothetical protein [Gammaproteobacteria bacterium]